MTDANQRELGLSAKLVIASAIVLTAVGALWHGVTLEIFQRIWHDMVDRPSGPMALRFILQPSMATIAAIHDGLKDARANRSPYFWTVLSNPKERVGRLREGLNATARFILIAIVVDAVYQILVLKAFYPAEAVIIGLLLAFVPYLLLRGVVARFARWRGGSFPHRLS